MIKTLIYSIIIAACLASCAEGENNKENIQVKNQEKNEVKNAVINSLKEPESARFGEITVMDDRACVTINAKNIMGGYSGNKQMLMAKMNQQWLSIETGDISHDFCVQNWTTIKTIPSTKKANNDLSDFSNNLASCAGYFRSSSRFTKRTGGEKSTALSFDLNAKNAIIAAEYLAAASNGDKVIRLSDYEGLVESVAKSSEYEMDRLYKIFDKKSQDIMIKKLKFCSSINPMQNKVLKILEESQNKSK